MSKDLNILTLFALVLCGEALFMEGAHAQTASAGGIATGDNVIIAAVPQAGRIFGLIDDIEALQESLTNCSVQGALPDGGGACRGSEEPDVEFSGNVLRVQRPFPDYGDMAEYTGLDGDDGIWVDVTP